MPGEGGGGAGAGDSHGGRPGCGREREDRAAGEHFFFNFLIIGITLLRDLKLGGALNWADDASSSLLMDCRFLLILLNSIRCWRI